MHVYSKYILKNRYPVSLERQREISIVDIADARKYIKFLVSPDYNLYKMEKQFWLEIPI